MPTKMRIGLVTPAPPGSRFGNRVTALRWARILRSLGHRVRIAQEYRGENDELLIALHARRSFAAIAAFARRHPQRPLIVVLAGTDLYRDLKRSKSPWKALELATRIVVLQSAALDELPARLRQKARVILQSAEPVGTTARRRMIASRDSKRRPWGSTFDVCVIGHLRPVKDPFRAALAARRLPASSRVRILHVGGAMTTTMENRAGREMAVNPRYYWLGEKSPEQARALLAESDLCVISSRSEGGANVISEALVDGVPVLASHIPGNVGMLGADFPGYFPLGDTQALTGLLIRAETDGPFLARLQRAGGNRAKLFHPAREKRAWAKLLGESVGR